MVFEIMLLISYKNAIDHSVMFLYLIKHSNMCQYMFITHINTYVGYVLWFFFNLRLVNTLVSYIDLNEYMGTVIMNLRFIHVTAHVRIAFSLKLHTYFTLFAEVFKLQRAWSTCYLDRECLAHHLHWDLSQIHYTVDTSLPTMFQIIYIGCLSTLNFIIPP